MHPVAYVITLFGGMFAAIGLICVIWIKIEEWQVNKKGMSKDK